MNKIYACGFDDQDAFLGGLEAGFKLNGAFISRKDTKFTINNKYASVILDFSFHAAESDASAYIYNGKPSSDPILTDEVQILVVVDKDIEVGQLDHDDYFYEYVLELEEAAELLTQTAWTKYS